MSRGPNGICFSHVTYDTHSFGMTMLETASNIVVPEEWVNTRRLVKDIETDFMA
ncbi:hypothetical protein ARMGADRAFT_1013925 [Armillaria gallica]|uniref:Uncharacterized protein n=1 Tax=Armillaria gallica TaxID=47427 RepID=A0A2H3D8H1_ARMGA|nr:hypothetical protein ARMGADRAFT_1013925 [Armillaria gallica]